MVISAGVVSVIVGFFAVLGVLFALAAKWGALHAELTALKGRLEKAESDQRASHDKITTLAAVLLDRDAHPRALGDPASRASGGALTRPLAVIPSR